MRTRVPATRTSSARPPGAAGGDDDAVGARLAYGDIKAPAEVDTLRDEACPVCGETDAWDGDECKVCGFVAPPDKFQDPDVDMHKRLDLRNNGDLDGGDVSGLNADINDRDGDGLDDNTGLPVDQAAGLGADDTQPMLVCPACGYEAPAAEPQTVSTDQPQGAPPDPGLDPEQAEQTEATDAAAEGDLCPNCGQAPLVGPETAAEMGIGSGGMEEGQALEMGDPDADPVDPRSEDPSKEDPEGDPNAGPPDPDDPDAEEDLEEEDRGSPFPSKDDGSVDDDEDQDPDEESDDDSDDSDKPAGKKFPPTKK